MLRLFVTIAIIVALVYVGATVKLGNRTLFGHVRAIWHTEQVQELKAGVKEKAGPAVDRVKRGIEAGYNAMKDDGGQKASEPANTGERGPNAGSAPGSASSPAPAAR